MPVDHPEDRELQRSTNHWMLAGTLLLFAFGATQCDGRGFVNLDHLQEVHRFTDLDGAESPSMYFIFLQTS